MENLAVRTSWDRRDAASDSRPNACLQSNANIETLDGKPFPIYSKLIQRTTTIRGTSLLLA